MADAYKILGQSAPAATTLTALYTVPASTFAIVNGISVVNRGTAATFRISVAIGGAANTNAQYLYFDISIPANDTFLITTAVALGASDVIRVFASSANLTFTAFGFEITGVSETYKVLGQAVSTGSSQNLYTVPASTQVVIGALFICNRGGTAATFSVNLSPNGAALANSHRMYDTLDIPANDTFLIDTGIAMDASDILRLTGSNTNLSFNAFGIEF